MVADISLSRIDSYFAESVITYGLVVQQGTLDNQALAIAELPVADVDAVTATPLASAATAQEFDVTDFDGDDAGGPYIPARTLTFALNSHADWLATQMRCIYVGADGVVGEFLLDIPANGNVILESPFAISELLAVKLPAQGGTNGTITIGLDVTDVALQRKYFPGVAAYAPGTEPSVAAVGDADVEDAVGVLTKGRIWVTVEAAVTKGDPCYVRMVESGSDLRGQVRGSAAANFALLAGAVFVTSADTDAVAQLEMV
jgi:hypothetical protein